MMWSFLFFEDILDYEKALVEGKMVFLYVHYFDRLKVSVLEGEAMAVLEAIRFVSSKGWHNVIFESDSCNLVNSLSSQCSGVSEFYILLSVINDQLFIHSNFRLKFIRR